MKTEKLTFYLLKDTGLIAKGIGYSYWFYYNNKWEEDTESIVSDKLNGFDSSEPEDSPYAFGSTSVMDEIKEISYEEAMNLLADQIVYNLIYKWSEDFKERKAEWDQNPEWPAKHVETSFCLFGNRYTLTADDLGLSEGPWDEGFMETIQKDMEKDLAEVGATEISSIGFLD